MDFGEMINKEEILELAGVCREQYDRFVRWADENKGEFNKKKHYTVIATTIETAGAMSNPMLMMLGSALTPIVISTIGFTDWLINNPSEMEILKDTTNKLRIATATPDRDNVEEEPDDAIGIPGVFQDAFTDEEEGKEDEQNS